MWSPSTTDRKILTVLLIGLATLLVTSGHIATPDGHLRLAQAAVLLDRGSFALPRDVGNRTHGNIAQGRDGKWYSVYNPGHIVLLTVPTLIARALPDISIMHDHYVAAFFASMLGPIGHFLSAYVVASTCLLLGVRQHAAVATAILYAVATVALPHATDGYDHTFEALFIVLGLRYAVLSSLRDGVGSQSRAAALCAISIGCGLLFRSTAVLAVPGLLIVLRHWRACLIFGATLVPFFMVLALYNWSRFGSALETGYLQAWGYSIGTNRGFFSTPLADGLYGLWLSPGKGLLLFSPILILAISGLPAMFQRNRFIAIAVITTTILYSGVYGMNFAWHGSAWCWGPRYLIPIVPLLMLAMPAMMPLGRVTSVAAIALVVLSLAVQIIGVSVDYRRHLTATQIVDPRALEDSRIFLDTKVSPILGQIRSADVVLRQLNSQEPTFLYLAPGPWKNEQRPVQPSAMLENSLDFNTLNFWWARAARMAPTRFWRAGGHLLGLSLLISVVIGIVIVWRWVEP